MAIWPYCCECGLWRREEKGKNGKCQLIGDITGEMGFCQYGRRDRDLNLPSSIKMETQHTIETSGF